MADAIRGSNRAVEEYVAALARAEHELEVARQRVETLRRKAAGPHYPAPCCQRWSWEQNLLSPHWNWDLRWTCGVEWDERQGWHGCRFAHEHHGSDPEPIPHRVGT